MNCSPKQVNDLLKKLRRLKYQQPLAETSNDWDSGYKEAMTNAICIVKAIFGSE